MSQQVPSGTDEFIKGLWRENPVFVQVLGMCPVLAVSNTALNALAMGLATLFVLGLVALVWALEAAARHFQGLRGERLEPPQSLDNWNPLDLDAWFYGQRPRAWWALLKRYDPRLWRREPKNRKLDQSMVGLLAYCFHFFVMGLVLSSIGGCWDNYEMPAGGGEQARAAGQGSQAADRLRIGGDPAVGALFQELVVAGVDDEQVRLMAEQLFHQVGGAVAGVADAAGIVHLEAA